MNENINVEVSELEKTGEDSVMKNCVDSFDPLFEFIEETRDKNNLYLKHVDRTYRENIILNSVKALHFLYNAYYMLYGFWGAILNAICPCWCVNSTHRAFKEVRDIFLEEEFTDIIEYEQRKIDEKILEQLANYVEENDNNDFDESEKEPEQESDSEKTEQETEQEEEEEEEEDQEHEQEQEKEDETKLNRTPMMTRLRKRNLNKEIYKDQDSDTEAKKDEMMRIFKQS